VIVVNPNRQDDLSGQGRLCAAGVVFLTLAALNRELRRRGHWTRSRPEPDLLAGSISSLWRPSPMSPLSRGSTAPWWSGGWRSCASADELGSRRSWTLPEWMALRGPITSASCSAAHKRGRADRRRGARRALADARRQVRAARIAGNWSASTPKDRLSKRSRLSLPRRRRSWNFVTPTNSIASSWVARIGILASSA